MIATEGYAGIRGALSIFRSIAGAIRGAIGAGAAEGISATGTALARGAASEGARRAGGTMPVVTFAEAERARACVRGMTGVAISGIDVLAEAAAGETMKGVMSQFLDGVDSGRGTLRMLQDVFNRTEKYLTYVKSLLQDSKSVFSKFCSH